MIVTFHCNMVVFVLFGTGISKNLVAVKILSSLVKLFSEVLCENFLSY